ncbi:MAG: ASPIC/UnbV domain-containing protein, partial [Planctomycetota bacterium]|nr:ASPIC/UnbV domain-containing protein [Planctomycetota bacterium]
SANRAAIGAKVELSFLPPAGDVRSSPTRTLQREVTATGGFQAGLAAEVHFGLGALGAPTSGRVIWPDGVSQPFTAKELRSAGKWIVVTRSEAR